MSIAERYIFTKSLNLICYEKLVLKKSSIFVEIYTSGGNFGHTLKHSAYHAQIASGKKTGAWSFLDFC